MLRRSFLLWAGAATATAGSAIGFTRWQEIAATIHSPGQAEADFLRKRPPMPPPSATIDTAVVILGSGIAGLSAAWQLKKLGHEDFLLIEGPQRYGNAAGGHFGDRAYPTGAHRLPLPSPESVHVRAMLADLGIITAAPLADNPLYDARFVERAPAKRLLLNGRWQPGLLPSDGGVAHQTTEHKRFFDEVARLRLLRGRDGKRIFVTPSALSSQDPEWLTLDRISLKSWLFQNGFRAPTLHWYLNYCCRADYGMRYDQISAWAGLHHHCSRWNPLENAGNDTWLTWPDGLAPLAEGLDKAAGGARRHGTAISLKTTAQGVEALCFTIEAGIARSYLVRARQAICAMPLHIASQVVERIEQYGFDPQRHLPLCAPWMVANFMMNDFPVELPNAPLCWDNVVYQEPGLGYVASPQRETHPPTFPKAIFTSYVALSDRTPGAARRWLLSASPDALLQMASADLKAAYGWKLAPRVARVDITLRAQAMAAPLPGFRSNAGLHALRELDGPILFAHGDLSGFSEFEEAAWWGCQAAHKVAGAA